MQFYANKSFIQVGKLNWWKNSGKIILYVVECSLDVHVSVKWWLFKAQKLETTP
jgi:hypothetical protein